MKLIEHDNGDLDVIFENEDLKEFSLKLKGNFVKAFKIYCKETDEYKVVAWWKFYNECLELDETVRAHEIGLYGHPLLGKDSVINMAYFIIKVNHSKYFNELNGSLYSSIPLMEEYIELIDRLWKEKSNPL